MAKVQKRGRGRPAKATKQYADAVAAMVAGQPVPVTTYYLKKMAAKGGVAVEKVETGKRGRPAYQYVPTQKGVKLTQWAATLAK